MVDGDTYDLVIHPYPGMSVAERIRLAAVDTPEPHSCEHDRATIATHRVQELLSTSKIRVIIYERDSFGRMLASVVVDGMSLAGMLVEEGLAIPYGDRWCLPDG